MGGMIGHRDCLLCGGVMIVLIVNIVLILIGSVIGFLLGALLLRMSGKAEWNENADALILGVRYCLRKLKSRYFRLILHIWRCWKA